MRAIHTHFVMAGHLKSAIADLSIQHAHVGQARHVSRPSTPYLPHHAKGVDARHKAGHDEL